MCNGRTAAAVVEAASGNDAAQLAAALAPVLQAVAAVLQTGASPGDYIFNDCSYLNMFTRALFLYQSLEPNN